MKISDFPQDLEPRVGDILEIEQDDVCFEVRIIGITADGYLCEQDNVEGAVLLEGVALDQDDVTDITGYITEEKVRLDPKCWKGKKIGNPKTKMKGGVRVNNCVPEGQEDIEEAGPFSYGAKKPRKGSVAYWAEKKRKEQEKGKPPIEPKDQMVGVAKVTKAVSEGSDNNVYFEVDSEKAYNHIMKKFRSIIDWDGDTMVAPQKYWGAIQELAYSAGGEAIEVGNEQGVAETSDYFRRREREEGIISGKRPARKKAPAQTSDYAKRREQEKKAEQGVREGSDLPPKVIEMIKKIAQSSATPEHKKAAIDALVAKYSKKGVAEGKPDQLPTQGADYSKYDTDHLKTLLKPGILHRNEARFKALIRKELQKRQQQGMAEGSDKLKGTPVVSLSDFDNKDNTKNKYGQTVPKKLKKDDPRVKFHKEPKKQGVAEGLINEKIAEGIVYATGPRSHGINDVDLIFKNLRTKKIVASVLGNNDHGGIYEIKIDQNGLKPQSPINFVAMGNPQDGSGEHVVYKLSSNRGNDAKEFSTMRNGFDTRNNTYYGMKMDFIGDDDYWSFLENMIGDIMWEDDAIEAGYVDRLDNGDLVFVKNQGVVEGLQQTLRKVVPGYAKREIDKKMDAGKFGKTDADKDANFQRYKKIQDKLKEQGVAEGSDDIRKKISKFEELALQANKAGDDAKSKMYQQKIQSLKQKMSQGVAEGYTGRETKDGTWRVFKDGQAVAVAGPFKSRDEAHAWIKKHKQGVSEAKSLKKRVRVVQGEHAGKTGWIREIKHGIHSTAPKRYYVDIDGGGQADNLPASALRLLKDQSDSQKGMAEGGHDDQFSLSGGMPATDRIPQDSTAGQDKVQAMVARMKQRTIDSILDKKPGWGRSDLELMTAAELNQILRDIQSGEITEAEYQGRKVALGKPMAGDVAKRKVYVRKPNGKVVKVNFGDKKMKIKKSNPKRRKSFRARHNCENPGPRWKARYWSCRAW